MGIDKYQVTTQCPVCAGQMYVRRLECEKCRSALEGQFNLGPFQNITREQLQFLEVFIRCRGQNKAIQEMLDISYPTVIKKMDELIIGLGFEPDPVSERREVLELLSQNKISALQAHQILANLSGPKSGEQGEIRQSGSKTNESAGE